MRNFSFFWTLVFDFSLNDTEKYFDFIYKDSSYSSSEQDLFLLGTHRRNKISLTVKSFKSFGVTVAVVSESGQITWATSISYK